MWLVNRIQVSGHPLHHSLTPGARHDVPGRVHRVAIGADDEGVPARAQLGGQSPQYIRLVDISRASVSGRPFGCVRESETDARHLGVEGARRIAEIRVDGDILVVQGGLERAFELAIGVTPIEPAVDEFREGEERPAELDLPDDGIAECVDLPVGEIT